LCFYINSFIEHFIFRNKFDLSQVTSVLISKKRVSWKRPPRCTFLMLLFLVGLFHTYFPLEVILLRASDLLDVVDFGVVKKTCFYYAVQWHRFFMKKMWAILIAMKLLLQSACFLCYRSFSKFIILFQLCHAFYLSTDLK